MKDNILHFAKLIIIAIIYCLICISNNILLIILSFVFYFYLIVKNRELSLELLTIVVFNFFNFIDPEIHGRVENVFKISDVLIALNIIYFFYKYKEFKVYNNKYIYIFLLYVIFEIIRSSIIYNQTFINALQTGRGFLFIFIILIYLSESNKESLKYREIFIFVIGIFCSAVLIFRKFFPNVNFPTYALGNFTEYNYSYVGKIYLSGALTIYLCCFYVISSIITDKLTTNKLLLLIYFLAGIFCFVFRIFWFAFIVAVIYILINQNIKNLSKVIIFFFFFVAIFYSTKYFLPGFYETVYNSAYSAYLDVTNPFGANISGRVSNDLSRFDLIRENLLIGIGFYHPSITNIFYRTIDTGYVDILISLGIIGFVILLLIYISIYKEAKHFTSNWGMVLKMFVVFSIVSLPAAATMSDIIYGYMPLALVYGLKNKNN